MLYLTQSHRNIYYAILTTTLYLSQLIFLQGGFTFFEAPSQQHCFTDEARSMGKIVAHFLVGTYNRWVGRVLVIQYCLHCRQHQFIVTALFGGTGKLFGNRQESPQ